jgi:hypothetical protein
MGCHRIEAESINNRADTPLCTKCHIGVSSNSTNAKHDQKQCYNCHQSDSSTSSSNQLGDDSADAQAFTPIKRECFSESACHNSTVITGWSNNSFAHAGRDCRYCHGHGHNITRVNTWNRSCGNTDSICHSASAPAPRNIGGDATFRHGGPTNNVTCGDCHIPSGSIAHNITVPSCRKCHNSTGIGNASTGRSSIYGDSGDTRSNTTPNWDRGNNIYHSASGFGTLGGMNCSYCHTPGVTDTTKVHYINTTQNQTTNSNIVPDCRDTRCHGSGGAGTYIQFSHGEAVVTASSPYGRDLTCVMCHNNYSIYLLSSSGNYSRTINTYLHTSANSGYNITPYNSTRDAQGNVSNQVCLNCHQGTTGVAGNCGQSGCHGNATGALLIHDDDMEQAGTDLNGVMAAGNPDCSESGCHDIDDPGSSMGQINFTALNVSVHAKLNENATMTISPVKGAVVRACWGCHNWKADGAEPPSGSMSTDGSNHKEPATCFMCHNGTDLFVNVSNAPQVFEHFSNGSDIKAANSSATIVLSCLGCHNKTEMIQVNNDPDTNKTNWADQDGDGIIGGNRSFYHYGKNRSSELRVSRSSYADCGENSESTTNCSNWNQFPASPTYTFTNCSYCHQNTTTGFESAMEDSYHKNILNHSDNSNNPYCTDCHIINDGNTTYRIHDNALTKPYNASSESSQNRGGGMYNSSLCTTCHRGQKEVHSKNAPGNNKLECASCHANASNWTSEKQIHGIRYINDSGVYSQQWDRAAAANCTTCHQRDFITYVNGTLSGYLAGVNNGSLIPKIPFPLNHSNNASAGSLWNNTNQGYFGPWKNPDSNNLRGCLYCHGNIDKDQTTINDINKTIHNATGLGRVNVAYRGTNYINGSVNTTSYWCSNCHTQFNTNYTAIGYAFNTTGWEVPVNNTDYDTREGYFNHSSTLSGGAYYDSKCFTCHKGDLPTGTNMTAFVHNVAIGEAGNPNCASSDCHDGGGSGSAYVNVSVMNQSDASHWNLNNRTGDPGVTGEGQNYNKSSGDFNWNSRRCWACHSNGSAPPTDTNSGMGLNWTNPYLCPDCHLPTGTQFSKYFQTGTPSTDNARAPMIVYEHYSNGSDIKTKNITAQGTRANNYTDQIAASCVKCHNKSQMILSNNDAEQGSADKWTNYVGDGDGNIGGQNSYYHYGRNRSDLRNERNQSQCGDNNAQTTNCSSWNLIPINTNYSFTNCTYCHLNDSTSFVDAMRNPTFKNISIHTNDSTGPFCTDCHVRYDGVDTKFRIHDATLTKPYNSTNESVIGRVGGMFNSTLCATCHKQKEVHSKDDPNANTLECASCHTNPSVTFSSGTSGTLNANIEHDRATLKNSTDEYSGNSSPDNVKVGDPPAGFSAVESTATKTLIVNTFSIPTNASAQSSPLLIIFTLYTLGIGILGIGLTRGWNPKVIVGIILLMMLLLVVLVSAVTNQYNQDGSPNIKVGTNNGGVAANLNADDGTTYDVREDSVGGGSTDLIDRTAFRAQYEIDGGGGTNCDDPTDPLLTLSDNLYCSANARIGAGQSLSVNSTHFNDIPAGASITQVWICSEFALDTKWDEEAGDLGYVNVGENSTGSWVYTTQDSCSSTGCTAWTSEALRCYDVTSVIDTPAKAKYIQVSIFGHQAGDNNQDIFTDYHYVNITYSSTNFRGEVWHNSTSVSYSGTLDSVNATLDFRTNLTDTYNLSIRNWNSGGWTECNSGSVNALTWTRWNCNMSTNPANYISTDNRIQISINSTADGDRGQLEEDYIQFYVDYTITADNPPTLTNAKVNTTGPTTGTIKMNMSITDDNSVDYALFTVNGTNYSATNVSGTSANDWYFNWACTVSNSYYWNVSYANDTSNNLNSTTAQGLPITFVCDVDTPSLTTRLINETGSINTNTFVCINATASDAEGNLDTIWAQITDSDGTDQNVTLQNPGPCGTSPNTHSANVNVGSSAGTFYFNASWANDTAGNIGGNTTSIPSIQVTAPSLAKDVFRYYIKFDISNVPSGSTINEANLSIYITEAGPAGQVGILNGTTGDYGSGDTNQTIHDSTLQQNGVRFDPSPSGAYKNVTITSIVQTALSNGQSYAAMQIRTINETNITQQFNITGSGGANPPKLNINYTGPPSEKQIHGIRYINENGAYSEKWTRAGAANCTTCHQGNTLTYVNGTLAGYLAGVNNGTTIPKVPQPINHSQNTSAGSLWNNTDSGFFGPWKNPESNNLRGCLYCHGNVDKSQTTVDDINLTVHNATPTEQP